MHLIHYAISRTLQQVQSPRLNCYIFASLSCIMNIAHTLHDTHKNINLETVTKFYKKYKQLHFKYIHIYLNIFFELAVVFFVEK